MPVDRQGHWHGRVVRWIMVEGKGPIHAHDDTVAAALRGREVSRRLIPPLLEGATRLGARADHLVRGTGFTVAELSDRRERMPWSVFMTFVTNLGAALDDAQIVTVGEGLIGSPIHRAFLLPGRLLFTLPEIYRWGAGPNGPLAQLLSVQTIDVSDVGPRRLRFDVTMKPSYVAAREFWLLRLGFLRSVSRAFGLPPADVTLTTKPNGAVFHLELPPDHGLATRIRLGRSWIFAAKHAAAELQAANDDLHHRYVELQVEVQARKDAEDRLRILNAELEQRVLARTAELEAANLQLAAANAELTIFSAAVAHDLRAPLRTIRGFTHILAEDHAASLDAEATAHLDRIVAGAERMGTLIDALLALSRITRSEVARQRLDLGELARTILGELRLGHPSRDVELSIGPALTLEADPALVRALMENLLGNAWKFTRNRTNAQIEITRVETTPVEVFRVRDNGVGFDMKHAGKLFAPFQRVHAATEFEGTGIGLAIVDRVVRRHGGKIWVDAAEDRGAAFSFTLRPPAG